MAKLLTISALTFRSGVNNLGDIVAIFPDEHEFSKAELDGFKIVSVDGKPDEVQVALDKMIPDLSAFIVVDPLGIAKTFINIDWPKYNSAVKDEAKTVVSEACKTNIKAVAKAVSIGD
jgi:hypothetical protein